MVKQQRALRTRGALLRAAAEVFDEQGYGGASFTQICKRVGISMGALTYHFSTKDDLVAAIRAEGRAITGSTVERVVSGALPPLCAAVELTLAVTDLLGADAAVRATARLSRERQALEPAWASLWAEPLGDLIRRAGCRPWTARRRGPGHGDRPGRPPGHRRGDGPVPRPAPPRHGPGRLHDPRARADLATGPARHRRRPLRAPRAARRRHTPGPPGREPVLTGLPPQPNRFLLRQVAKVGPPSARENKKRALFM
ncbi:TetR family transcriptional regulator [Streptomyces lasalocidi]